MTQSNKTVFITGGTGFIGKHLVYALYQQGYHIRCLVRKTSRTAPLKELGVELIYGDVNDQLSLEKGIKDCQWVIHLANVYAMWHPHPEEFNKVNCAGTRLVMQTALDYQVEKVVYVSTVAVYGKPQQTPFREHDPRGPQLFSRYARSKAAGEEIAWEMHQKHNLPLVVLYPGIVLGVGDDKPSGQYIKDILRQRVPTPIYRKSVNTYVSVQNTVEAILAAAQKDTIGKRYLIGNEWLNGLDYVRLICEVSGAPMPPLRLPDGMVNLAGRLNGWLADVFKKEPLWGLCPDACATLQNGFIFDGSLAAQELGITYTPIRETLNAACKDYRLQFKSKR